MGNQQNFNFFLKEEKGNPESLNSQQYIANPKKNRLNILIIGSGGRAHAFSWKISESKLCSKLFIAPGNAGTSQYGTNVSISISDFTAIRDLCVNEQIEIVFIGPEDPLVNGITDFLLEEPKLKDLNIIGPSKEGARLEGSKAFAKSFMNRHNIPTAAYREFDKNNYEEGIHYIRQQALPVVLKADGLAAGKGVLICSNYIEAMAEFELMIQDAKFGEAGRTVVVEEFLKGIELSVFILTDGNNYLLLPEAKDYKRAGENDTGLNTGGMGAVSPVPFAHESFMEKVKSKIIEPTLNGLKLENISYRGFIFFGLIKVEDEPMVIEYNCRMGDPESEVILLRLKNDIVELFQALPRKRLHEEKVIIDPRCAATIVAVSGGYPGNFLTGKPIDFGYLENPESIKTINADGGVMVFQMGTIQVGDETFTSGGRVLAVTALADTIGEAVGLAKETLGQIYFEEMYYRSDIGFEFYD